MHCNGGFQSTGTGTAHALQSQFCETDRPCTRYWNILNSNALFRGVPEARKLEHGARGKRIWSDTFGEGLKSGRFRKLLILQDKKRWYPRKSKYLTERRFRLKSLESRRKNLWGHHGAKDQQVENIKSRTGQWRLHALYTRSARYETCRPTTCLWRRSGEEQGPASGAGIEPSSTLRKQHTG